MNVDRSRLQEFSSGRAPPPRSNRDSHARKKILSTMKDRVFDRSRANTANDQFWYLCGVDRKLHCRYCCLKYICICRLGWPAIQKISIFSGAPPGEGTTGRLKNRVKALRQLVNAKYCLNAFILLKYYISAYRRTELKIAYIWYTLHIGTLLRTYRKVFRSSMSRNWFTTYLHMYFNIWPTK